MKPLKIPLIAAGFFALSAMWAGAAMAAGPYATATVEGALAPGVYGRIEIGNASPPPLIYAQPVIIQRPAVVVHQQPMYLHVPPGHAKKWSKHCAKYNACGQPVYFVKVNGDDDYERGKDKHKDKHKHKGDRDDQGRGEKHGRGRD